MKSTETLRGCSMTVNHVHNYKRVNSAQVSKYFLGSVQARNVRCKNLYNILRSKKLSKRFNM